MEISTTLNTTTSFQKLTVFEWNDCFQMWLSRKRINKLEKGALANIIRDLHPNPSIIVTLPSRAIHYYIRDTF